MIRLEEILNYLYKLDEKEINWPDLACKFQFSDQPHLIRYLKKRYWRNSLRLCRDERFNYRCLWRF